MNTPIFQQELKAQTEAVPFEKNIYKAEAEEVMGMVKELLRDRNTPA